MPRFGGFVVNFRISSVAKLRMKARHKISGEETAIWSAKLALSLISANSAKIQKINEMFFQSLPVIKDSSQYQAIYVNISSKLQTKKKTKILATLNAKQLFAISNHLIIVSNGLSKSATNNTTIA